MLKLPPSASNSNREMDDEQMMYDFAYSRNEDISVSVHFIIRFSQVFYHFYSEKLFFLAKTFKFFAPAAPVGTAGDDIF